MNYLLAALLLTTPAMAGFDEQWGDALQDIETMQRRLYSDPRKVKTDKVLPDPPKTNDKVVQAPKSIRKSLNKADVCARVGKRKVVSGKTWRCR